MSSKGKANARQEKSQNATSYVKKLSKSKCPRKTIIASAEEIRNKTKALMQK